MDASKIIAKQEFQNYDKQNIYTINIKYIQNICKQTCMQEYAHISN